MTKHNDGILTTSYILELYIPIMILLLFVGISASTNLAEGKEAINIIKATHKVETGYIKEFALASPRSGPAIVAIDSSDNIWVALARSGQLAKMANGKVTLYDIGKDKRPVGLIAGSIENGYPGEIWIAASYDNKIIRFDTATTEIREYAILGENSWPFNIAIGPDKHIWFTQRAGGKIGRLNPSSGKVKDFELPTKHSGPAGLAIDQSNGTVWFTQAYADGIGRLDPSTGKVQEFKMGTQSSGMINGPAGLTIAPDGGVWFAKLEGKLGHIAPGSSVIDLVDVPAGAARPAGIIAGDNGDIWTMALDGNQILRYQATDKHFTVYPIPVGSADTFPSKPPLAKTSRPFGLALDSKGNFWFSQQFTGQLGVLDMAGPELKLFSPGRKVTMPDPLVTIQALDRVAGISEMTLTLDGKEVSLNQGRLNLLNTLPGRHHLTVEVTDGSGAKNKIVHRFSYQPSKLAMIAMVEAIELDKGVNQAGKDQLEMLAKSSRNKSWLKDLEYTLSQNGSSFGSDTKALKAAIVWFKANNQQQQQVIISDTKALFSNTDITIKKGGTVSWTYDGKSSGHEISHKLHQIAISPLGAKSPILRAGETFSQVFNQVGEFEFEDMKTPGVKGQIRVVL